MSRNMIPVVLLIGVLVIAGCRQTDLSPRTFGGPEHITTLDLITVTPSTPLSSESTQVYTDQDYECAAPYRSKNKDHPQYLLDALIGVSEHVMNVEQAITYPNSSDDFLDSIKMVVEPIRIENVFKLTDLRIGDTIPENYTLSNGYLEIPLANPLPPGCAIEINLAYTLAMPNQNGLFGYTDDQLILTNWYPFIPPYSPERKWQTHLPSGYGEHLVYPIADFTVSLSFKEETIFPIAAPAPARAEGDRTIYVLENARTFSLAVLPGHRQISRKTNGITFQVYYPTGSAAAAQSALDILVNAVDTYEDLFGEYPFGSLTTAEIDMFDGMEYDGIFFLGQDIFSSYNHAPQNLFTLLVAHETAHNWWFSQVANDQALEPWLDEALATYCELLYLEKNLPELEDWWWEFRIFDAKPVGPIDVSIYQYADYERYRQAVYLRGALFLHAVREQVGDEAFFEFLHQYYLAGKNKIVSADLFFEILEQVTGLDPEPLHQEFFNQ